MELGSVPLEGNRRVRVLIADDQALVRAGFKALLGADPEIEVAGEAATGAEAVSLARSLKPDVILMDVRMPLMDGLEATRQILRGEESAETKVLILTTFDLDEYVYEGLRAGASGFVLKDIDPAGLIQAVHVVARGEALLAPSVTRRLIADCECENGCPACVGPVGNTGPLAKMAALRMLDLMLAEVATLATTQDAEARTV